MAKKMFKFNVRAFKHDFRQAMKKVSHRMRDELTLEIKREIRKLPFKTNEVKLANGDVTSDAKRKAALLDSFIKDIAKFEEDNIVRSTTTAMADKFKDSHIGLYYEFGTGENQDGGTYESLGTPNLPWRVPNTGARVVTRSYRTGGAEGATSGLYTQVDGKPAVTWRDPGGNMRISFSPKAGERYPGFIKYIGEDVEAWHWFRNAVQKSQAIKEGRRAFKYEALKDFNLAKYITLAEGTGKFVIGVD